jgi:hypothetical protein
LRPCRESRPSSPTSSSWILDDLEKAGWDSRKKIKAAYPNIIIFILSNYDTPEYRKATLDPYRWGLDFDREAKKNLFGKWGQIVKFIYEG